MKTRPSDTAKGCSWLHPCFLLNDDEDNDLSSFAHYRKKDSPRSNLVQHMPQCSQMPFRPEAPAPLGPLPLPQLRGR